MCPTWSPHPCGETPDPQATLPCRSQTSHLLISEATHSVTFPHKSGSGVRTSGLAPRAQHPASCLAQGRGGWTLRHRVLAASGPGTRRMLGWGCGRKSESSQDITPSSQSLTHQPSFITSSSLLSLFLRVGEEICSSVSKIQLISLLPCR